MDRRAGLVVTAKDDMDARWVRENRPAVAAVGLGVGLTLFVTVLPFLQFAYDNPQLHLALETAEG
ncbi:MAG: hypothetical protein M3203_15770, partial [Actinomycetota bacterium]|nr:hypothetical protein [Actinomycetota bacterium]